MKLLLLILVASVSGARAEEGCGASVIPVPPNRVVVEVESQLEPTESVRRDHTLHIYPAQVKFAKRNRPLVYFSFKEGDVAEHLTIKINGTAISVPQRTQVGLLNYFRNQPQLLLQRFDCHDFMSSFTPLDCRAYVYQCYSRIRAGVPLKAVPNEAVIATGDAVVLFRKVLTEMNQMVWDIVHSAVFLAPGYYLSKLGPSGPLAITTYEELKAHYRADAALHLPIEVFGQLE
jgi:hypothetical protein